MPGRRNTPQRSADARRHTLEIFSRRISHDGFPLNARLPATRQSLIVRMKDPHDVHAWSEFESIYRPAVYRFARHRNLQPADADDLAQRVMMAVSKKISEWNPDSQVGSFRAWVLTVTRNATANLLRERFAITTVPIGDDWSEEENESMDWELKRSVFRRVASEVQREFNERTWQAFWQVAVEGKSVSETATNLEMSVGSVYTSKCRVLKRFRIRAEQLNRDLEMGELEDRP